tara:strand:- start:1500 stop:1706 length:207 start_codon:yes stop_codon:yes gene_type:complete
MSGIISALEIAQRDLAVSALAEPKRDPFDHGYEAGVYAGMSKAIDIILQAEGSAKPREKAAEKQSVYS